MSQAENTHDETIVRAKAFDWWFSQFTGLYDVLLKLVWARRHRKALPHIVGPRVLEVSFGTGYLMAQYAGKYETTGLDYNPRYVEAARRRMAASQLHANLVQGDAHDLPFPDASFNTLINTDAFTLYQDPAKAMHEFHRVLVPGGRLILMEYDYPKDGNWLGKVKVAYARRVMKLPYIAFAELLRSVGFTFEDYAVGNSGIFHMWVATKPE